MQPNRMVLFIYFLILFCFANNLSSSPKEDSFNLYLSGFMGRDDGERMFLMPRSGKILAPAFRQPITVHGRRRANDE